MSPGGQPLADFATRLLAYMIDTAIVSAVFTVIFTPVALIVMFQRMSEIDMTTATESDFVSAMLGPLVLLELGFFAVLLVAYYIYYVEVMHRSGQTIGKKAMKIRVVPLDPSARLTRGMATKRYLMEFFVGLLVPFFSWLDGLWQLWDKPYLQTLHDKVAKTIVVKVGP